MPTSVTNKRPLAEAGACAGGLVMSAFGHLPKRNETTEIGPYRFRILNADSRRIHLIRLTPIAR